MSQDLTRSLDAVLLGTVSGASRVPGVVAMVTDRQATIYEGAAGQRTLGQDGDITTDAVFAIFSCTKAITGTAIMQLVQEGRVDLDAPAKTYAPHIADVQVMDGVDAEGRPILRAPKRDITTRMLMLHTAGFGYEFFSAKLRDAAAVTGQKSVITSTKAALMAPLLFDPGDDWDYGINIDWCGQVVEGARGKRLGDVFAERIFAPLGMTDTAFTMTPSMRARVAGMHQRAPDGTLSPIAGFELPQDPEVQMGGHALYATIGDYCRFIRMYLNDGMGEGGRVLKPETIAMAEKNGLGDKKVRMLPGAIPSLSNDAEFFPGLSKSWAYSFMVNDEKAPTGRPAGALGWAGLANLFFWIDRRGGLGGFWATQILPFADAVSFTGYMDFETAVYRQAMAQAA